MIIIIGLPLLHFACAISGGGSVQSSQQYPFSVTLTNPILCGGSIISLNPAFIMTAAHCIEDYNIYGENTPSVAYGSNNFSTQSYAQIKRVITHPLYMSSSQQMNPVYTSDRRDIAPYDIALIELTKPLLSGPDVHRVRLYIGQSNGSINGFLVTIGMGYIGYQQPETNILQYAKCNTSNISPLQDNNFNNSIILGRCDAGLCHGDSGSPLMYIQSPATNTNNTTDCYLIGILNTIANAYDPDPENISCPLRTSRNMDFVNIFVKPSSHIHWITEVTGLSEDAFTAPILPLNMISSSFSSTACSTVVHSRKKLKEWLITINISLLSLIMVLYII